MNKTTTILLLLGAVIMIIGSGCYQGTPANQKDNVTKNSVGYSQHITYEDYTGGSEW